MLEKLGASSKGVVHRALDPEFDRGVAIKTLTRRAADKASLPNEARIVGHLERASLNIMDYETPGADIVRLRK